jgi:hypothetical protein
LNHDRPRIRQKIKAKFGDLISEPAEFRGEITVKVADAEQIAKSANSPRNSWASIISWTSASVDNYGDDPRWTVVYHCAAYR